MNCPNCGAVIPDGKMYCEKCGNEIVVISDIDFELEMKNTMNDIAHKEFGKSTGKKNKYDDMEFDEDDNPSLIGLLFKKGSRSGWMFYVVMAIVILLVLIVALRMGRQMSKQNSASYQKELALEAAENQNYSQAITYLEKASKLDPAKSEYKFTIAEYYLLLDKNNDAVYTLTEIAENSEFNDAERVQAYNKLISILKDMNDFGKINDLLSECTLSTIIAQYSEFIVKVPEFNYEAGTYTDKIQLIISSEGNNSIYYSLDGSNPATNGILYTEPLSLEYGSYVVSAVSVNDYGIPSEAVTNKYLIDVSFSFSPKVEPESGDYEHAFNIEVDVPMMYTCYYTTDGTTPNKEAKKYNGPVPVAAGTNTYKFVVYASDGTQSEIIERTYSVVLQTELDPAAAVTKLNQDLIDRGYLDASGRHREGIEGTYIFMYSTIYYVEGMGDFYLVIEYIQDDLGNNKKTGNVYAIDCYNGVLYTVDTDTTVEGGGYKLNPMQ